MYISSFSQISLFFVCFLNITHFKAAAVAILFQV